MNGFKVIVEHDRYSRKPITINFKVSLLDRRGVVLHSVALRHKSFLYGMHEAYKYKRVLENPITQFGILAARISGIMDFKIDTTRTHDTFMEQVFENATVEWLEEYLKRTKNEKDIQFIKNEINKRGELS